MLWRKSFHNTTNNNNENSKQTPTAADHIIIISLYIIMNSPSRLKENPMMGHCFNCMFIIVLYFFLLGDWEMSLAIVSREEINRGERRVNQQSFPFPFVLFIICCGPSIVKQYEYSYYITQLDVLTDRWRVCAYHS